MVTEEKKLEAIKRKTRQRLVFTLFTMALYFSYVLSYTSWGAFLSDTLGDSHVSGSLALYVVLIIVFIVIEVFFLIINRDKKPQSGQG